MQCLLKYEWVKLPRCILSQQKGMMSYWMKLASRAAFRNGKALYCGYINEISVGSWSGGIVGLKSILGQKNRTKTFEIMDLLSDHGYISYTFNASTKKLTYRINDWVTKCSGSDCMTGSVYTTEGYGFLCLPRSITQRLTEKNYKFEDADAWLDLWCHSVYKDPINAFSYIAPTIQYDKYGAALTLENLGLRWGWEKTRVWRFLQKNRNAFTLHKLPGSFGCLIFNNQYPTNTEFTIPTPDEIIRILNKIRILGDNTHLTGTDNHRINKMINWYSKKLNTEHKKTRIENENGRVADSLYIMRAQAYISHCWNCKNSSNDCWMKYIAKPYSANSERIRGPCEEFGYRYAI